MKKFLALTASLIVLTACTSDGLGNAGRSITISKTAADEALPGAQSVRLTPPSRLQPGRIYKAAGGVFTEICSLDIENQTALKAIRVVSDTASTDTVFDQERFSKIELSAFGLKWGPNYEVRSVSGFQIFNAKVPSSNDVASYILANVRKGGPETCGGGVLKDKKNLPYFVVEATVVGTKVDVEYRGQASYDGGIGIAGGEVVLNSGKARTRTNVVFGAKGLLVSKLAK